MQKFSEKYLARIPIIGAYATLRGDSITESVGEVFASVVFSLLPVWLTATLLTIRHLFTDPLDGTADLTFLGALSVTVSNGELLMYATAALGPIIYVGLTLAVKGKKYFPWFRTTFFFAVMLGLVSTVLFYDARGSKYTVNQDFILLTGLIYALSLTLLFPFVAASKALPDPSSEFSHQTDDFVEDYQPMVEQDRE